MEGQQKTGGMLKRIAGPVVTAVGLDAHMYDVVKVGTEELMGEVIKVDGEAIIIQVYEDTTGLRPGEPVSNTGLSLAVDLGPGLLTSIYDGIQRPLEVLVDKMGSFIERGVSAPGIPRDKKWEFKPLGEGRRRGRPRLDHRRGPGDEHRPPDHGPAEREGREARSPSRAAATRSRRRSRPSRTAPSSR